MDFASAYILEEDEESDEEIQHNTHADRDQGIDSGDEDYAYQGGFECEIMEFDDDDEEFLQTNTKKAKARGSSLNTVNLKLQVLKDEKPELMMLDKFKYTCSNTRNCGALLSQIDKPIDIEGSEEKLWRCRFCGVERTIKEWPKFEDCPNGDVLFVHNMDSPPRLDLDPGENTIIFVLDVSGSMSHPMERNATTAMVPMMGMGGGGMRFMGGLMNMMGGQMPQMPQGKSRLEALRDGVVEEIKKLKTSAPKTKVGVLYFHNEIVIIGDGSQNEVTVAGKTLNDYTGLLTTGQKQRHLSTVAESCDRLVTALKRLKEGGQTALGPALVVATAMAAKSKTSKVILCTDGYANVGLGHIQSGINTETEDFYKDVAAHCKTQGVSVSLISFDECGYAKSLGELPVETGGLLWRVPANSDLNIQEILLSKTMATDAFVRFVVNKQLFVENAKDKEVERSNYTHLLGNIHNEMSHAFKFGFRSDENSKKQRKEVKDQSGLLNENPREDGPKITEITDTPADKKDDPAEMNVSDEKNEKQDEKMDDGEQKDEDEQKNVAERPGTSVTPFESNRNEINPAPQTPQAPDAKNEAQKSNEATEEKHFVPDDLNKESVPFQVQIFYVDLDGTEATRIWTSLKPITANKKKAEEASNKTTLIQNMIQTESKRMLEIFSGHIKDLSVNSEARKITQKTKEMTNDPDITDEERDALNKFSFVMNRISQIGSIDDSIAAELRTYQSKGVNLASTQTPVAATC